MTNEGIQRDDLASDLILALLAVNSWSLEQVGRLYDALHANDLFNVASLCSLGIDRIQERLAAAGYDRGPVLGRMMAVRMHHVACALANGGADRLLEFENAGNRRAARDYLLTLNGVGPTVADSYQLLRSSARA